MKLNHQPCKQCEMYADVTCYLLSTHARQNLFQKLEIDWEHCTSFHYRRNLLIHFVRTFLQMHSIYKRLIIASTIHYTEKQIKRWTYMLLRWIALKCSKMVILFYQKDWNISRKHLAFDRMWIWNLADKSIWLEKRNVTLIELV